MEWAYVLAYVIIITITDFRMWFHKEIDRKNTDTYGMTIWRVLELAKNYLYEEK